MLKQAWMDKRQATLPCPVNESLQTSVSIGTALYSLQDFSTVYFYVLKILIFLF